MKAGIAGIGLWLPERVRTNDDWPESFKRRDHSQGDRSFNDIPPSDDPVSAGLLARYLAREADDPFLGGVRRHVADDSTHSSSVEALAARAALADAGIPAEDVDIVLSYSVVPDRVVPPSGLFVANAIGARRATVLGIEVACATAVSQLEIARAYIESGMAKVVLLTQSHLILRTFEPLHPAAPGLGDAASAMVVTAGGPLQLRSTYGKSHGDYALAVQWVRSNDPTTETPWWKAGPDYKLSSRAPHLAKALMRDTVAYGAAAIRIAAERAGVDVERIDVLAAVQPRGFLPGAIAERLGLPHERAVTTYEEIAHVGACGPVFNLERARSRGLLKPGTIVALYGQGTGFTVVSAVLEVAPAGAFAR